MNRAERRAQLRAHNRAKSAALPQPRSAAASRVLKFHIDELVLHGFPLKTRHAVSEATQMELARLLTSSGLPEFIKNPVKSDRLEGGKFNVTSTTKPQVIGSLIASAVYGGQWR